MRLQMYTMKVKHNDEKLSTTCKLIILLLRTGCQEVVSKCSNIASSSRDMCNVLQHCLTLFTQQEQVLHLPYLNVILYFIYTVYIVCEHFNIVLAFTFLSLNCYQCLC